MEREELLKALRRQKVMDNLRCLGCGHEHLCSTKGCAINRAAAELIEQLAAENDALRHPPNPPLTPEELREMDGEPVWWEDKYKNVGYGIVSISEFDKIIYIVSANRTFVAIAHGEMNKHLGLTLFHRKPEEETT